MLEGFDVAMDQPDPKCAALSADCELPMILTARTGSSGPTSQDVLEILTVDQTHVHVQSASISRVVNRHDVRIIYPGGVASRRKRCSNTGSAASCGGNTFHRHDPLGG